MAIVYIGLGSNLGNREHFLTQAKERINRLPGTGILAESSVEETDPVGYTSQPRFLNQVIKIETGLPQHDLLDTLLTIETELGRTRGIPMGPRNIDCDILLYDALVIDDERLTVPHAGIRNRPFVLRQLLEIDGELRDPASSELYREVLENG